MPGNDAVIAQGRSLRGWIGRGAFIFFIAATAMTSSWYLADVVTNVSASREDERPTIADALSARFKLCGAMRDTCVVDGDTFWLSAQKIRIADIDTPEISEPKCPFEYEWGMKATYRLRDLLNGGAFELRPIGERDEDRYGRKLRIVVRDGQSIGEQLVKEGFARTWTGRRRPWC